MQIQYNITRIEEWCKSHDMPEGTLHLEHLMQAIKLLQLKKVGEKLPVILEKASDFEYRQHLPILRLFMTFAGCSVLCKYKGCVRTITLQNTRWVYGVPLIQYCDYTRPIPEPHFS